MAQATNIPLITVQCVILAFALTGCSRPEKDFDRARRHNTVDSYTRFLRKHPKSSQADSARFLLRGRNFDRALAARDTALLHDFLRRYDEGHDSDRIRAAISDTESWLAVRNTFEPGVLQAYIQSQAQPLFRREAESRLAELVHFRQAVDEDLLSPWLHYIAQYPQGIYADSAKARIATLDQAHRAWNTLGPEPDNRTLAAFAKEHPGTGYARQARRIVRQRELERIARQVLARPAYAAVQGWPTTLQGLKEYIARHLRTPRLRGRAELEEIYAEAIRRLGPGDLFRIPSVEIHARRSNSENADNWRYSIETFEGNLKLTPVTWKDMIPIDVGPYVIPNNSGVLTTRTFGRVHFLENTIWRIPSRLSLPGGYAIEGDIESSNQFPARSWGRLGLLSGQRSRY